MFTFHTQHFKEERELSYIVEKHVCQGISSPSLLALIVKMALIEAMQKN